MKQGNKSEESGAAGLTFSNLDTVSGQISVRHELEFMNMSACNE